VVRWHVGAQPSVIVLRWSLLCRRPAQQGPVDRVGDARPRRPDRPASLTQHQASGQVGVLGHVCDRSARPH